MICYPCYELLGFCFNEDEISSETYGLISKAFSENKIEEFYCDWNRIWGIRRYNQWEILIKFTEIDVEDRNYIIKWYMKKAQEDIKKCLR